MDKLVVKTAVKTVLIIMGVLIAVFAVFNFAFPQVMAKASESMGNYEIAVKYASLRYYYTKDCGDLARCFDDSVLLGNDDYILEYGEKLVSHKGFAGVCEEKDARQSQSGNYNYRHWVNSKLAVSYYNTGKVSEALRVANEDCGAERFEYGNAFMALTSAVRNAKDKDAAAEIKRILQSINPADETEGENLAQVIDILQKVADGN